MLDGSFKPAGQTLGRCVDGGCGHYRPMPIRRNKAVTDDQLRALLDLYVADTTVAAEGVLQFNSHETDELERMLPDAFDADPRFTRRQVRHLLRDALRTTRKTGRLNADRLNKEAKRLASERLAVPLRPFTMWTKFRANQMAFHPGFTVSWNGVEIEAVNDLPDALYVEPYFLDGHGEIYPSQPAFFGHLIARGEARDLDSAADLLINAMDVFMGLLNLYAV